MAKYVISPFLISRQMSRRKGDGLLASWPLLLSLSAAFQHCMYKKWCCGVTRWTTVYRISPVLVTLFLVLPDSGMWVLCALDSKREAIGPRGVLCPTRCRLCPEDNSQIRGWRISATSLAAAVAAAILPSETCPSSLLLFCSSFPSPYIFAFPPSFISPNPHLYSHNFLSLSLPLLCVICPYHPPLSSLSVVLVCNKPVWGTFQVCLE